MLAPPLLIPTNGRVLKIITRRSDSGKGSDRSSTLFTTLKTAVFTPMPRPRASSAATVKPGLRPNVRMAYRASRQLFSTHRRKRIELGPAIVLRKPPLRTQQPPQFHPVQCLVEGALLHPQYFIGNLLNRLRNIVAMHLAADQCLQDHHVQRARQQL